MPHYHFILRKGSNTIPDEDGCEFVNEGAAKEAALHPAHEMAAERILQGLPLSGCALDVSDGTGHEVYSPPFLSLV